MPSDMGPMSKGRMGALSAMLGGGGEAPPPEPEGDYEGAPDLQGIIDELSTDVLPTVPEEKRQHIEKAIQELEMCLGEVPPAEEGESAPEAPEGDETPAP